MKSMMGVCMVLLLTHTVYAQTSEEWLEQKKTQIKYLMAQIAALQVYGGYVSEGYNIAKKGLGAIGDFQGGEFYLHQTFFSSLLKVNPSIQSDYRIMSMVAMEKNIQEQDKGCLQLMKRSKHMSRNERDYVKFVFQNLLESCANDMDDVTSVVSDGNLRLSDDERLKRIGVIYQRIKDKYVFAYSFGNTIKGLFTSRQKEENETEEMKTLYHLQ